ncbi:hypothetical protein [Mesorhizobium sp. L-8-3]|uniref:hypothetical protein n=1 Tax=Mesorhizobium sp. L-8-3 TaxID=2744522 RepID=UPI001928E156|nr:hypothetical protein [Mesorhizobium sp. L-8-3]BCH27819.1 hypothetical protein MesoLjLb_76040 [Mesorhizobium sp. L-8-3]
MTGPDPYANDPFFKAADDPDWNACIGRQGEEENYVDGYIEAAMELADAVIEKQLFGKRDTLVLPILYNARHAIELALKFATDRLVAAQIVGGDRKRDHNIKAQWERLHHAAIGDEALSRTIAALEPFIESLSRIDSDGQELRYHRNRDDDPSLADYALANLKVIQTSLGELKTLIDDLQYRTVDFLREHATGSHTGRCSRRDLMAIARIMPKRHLWNTPAFDEQKAEVMLRFGFGSRQFSLALDQIQRNREMGAILGMETPLLHLSDEDIVGIVRQWRLLHPKLEKPKDGELGADYFGIERFEAMQHHNAALREVIKTLQAQLSPDQLADLETVYYLGRDRVFPEYYETLVAEKRQEHAATNNPQEEIRHLMEKTNFLRCVQLAAIRLGRVALAERLKDL